MTAGQVALYLGDCLEVLGGLEADTIDAIVTDPPYGIRFMGKEWDGKDIKATVRRKTRKDTCRPDGWKRHDGAAFAAGTYNLSPSANRTFQEWVQVWATLCLRVLKPGGHLLAFGSPRTCHRLAAGIEDAGFEIRDQIMWLFGSGFPKSHNLDGEWDGWGTALKPAHEPIVVARKPLMGTVAENVQGFGTGVLNIDGCRVPVDPDADASQLRTMNRGQRTDDGNGQVWGMSKGGADVPQVVRPEGRWPANVIHDGSDEVMAEFAKYGESSTKRIEKPSVCDEEANTWGGTIQRNRGARGHTDSGTAARFFYCAKASRKDRGEGNTHPTVKPTELMRYLCRLVAPLGGVVLDPFMGSGSTGKAALLEDFRFLGIERERDYFEIAKARIEYAGGMGAVEPRRVDPDREEAQQDLFSFTAV